MVDKETDVHLGYVGRPLDADEQLDIRLSRLGGPPVWLQLPGAPGAACELCGGALSHVGQFAAGYAGVPRRLLHIFACPEPACGSNPRAWRAWRSVAEAPAAGAAAGDRKKVCFQDAAPGAADVAAVPVPDDDDDDDDDDWGAGAGGSDDWGASGAAEGGGSVDQEIEALLAAGQKKAGPPAAGAAGGYPAAGASKAAGAAKAAAPLSALKPCASVDEAWVGVPDPATAELLPCCALEIYDEPPAEAKSGAYEAELLERYLKSDLADDEKASSEAQAASSLPADMLKELSSEADRMRAEADAESDELGEDSDDEEGSGEAAQWIGKFQRRLERSPYQVVRYSWGGQALWMAPPPKAGPPRCGRCGAARIFEIQLLPTLLAQACPEGHAASKLDWGNVVVYTCSEDCGADAGPCEEYVAVQPAL